MGVEPTEHRLSTRPTGFEDRGQHRPCNTRQGGCSTASNSGDFVEDTPAVAAPNFGCPPESTDSCPGVQGQLLGNDPVHNYMDYVDDSCMWEFTADQITRMCQAWNAYRA